MGTLKPTRITWLVGPPGAGKSTLANQLRTHCRVVEFTDMLGPLVNAVRLRKGVLGANGKLVEIVRHLELHPDNRALPPLLVVAGIVDETALFPLVDEAESVWLLLPERERWRTQLLRRPAGASSSGVYDDEAYATRWYERFEGWPSRGYPVRIVEAPFRAELVGATASRLLP